MGSTQVDNPSAARPWLARLATTFAAWLAAFLTVMVLFVLIGDELESRPLAVRALAVSGVLVILMLNLVMPVLGPAVARGLERATKPRTMPASLPPTSALGAPHGNRAYRRNDAVVDLPVEERERVHSLLVPIRAIGYVLTEYEDPASAPPQAALNPDDVGHVVVFDEYAEGLDSVEALDYAWLIVWLDRAPAIAPLRIVPRPLRETGERRGVFATRAPARPNRLGLSLVRILGREGNEIWFAGVDMARGTPVIDIKPYESQIDTPA